MHELSIAVNIVEVASHEASLRQGNAVAVHLNLGIFTGIDKESLRSAWELARMHSPLQNAELVISEIDAVGYCVHCNAERHVVSIQKCCCSHCGASLSEIRRGRELEIVALELDA